MHIRNTKPNPIVIYLKHTRKRQLHIIHNLQNKIQYRQLIPVPVDPTSASVWLYNTHE